MVASGKILSVEGDKLTADDVVKIISLRGCKASRIAEGSDNVLPYDPTAAIALLGVNPTKRAIGAHLAQHPASEFASAAGIGSQAVFTRHGAGMPHARSCGRPGQDACLSHAEQGERVEKRCARAYGYLLGRDLKEALRWT